MANEIFIRDQEVGSQLKNVELTSILKRFGLTANSYG